MEEAELLAHPELLKPLARSSKAVDLEGLTREELVDRVRSLEKHVQQLRNVIAKNTGSAMVAVKRKQHKETAESRCDQVVRSQYPSTSQSVVTCQRRDTTRPTLHSFATERNIKST
jgi:hypothetical protein